MAGEEELNRTTGKLVLFLADGTTLDIPLDHERVTVGRRSANDVCLPYAAVSGAHAVFVTTTDGVVVEDLGSTNGTSVNGTRTTRQLLQDGDRIDIGRQRFVYLADVDAVVPSSAQRKSAGRRAGDGMGGDANDAVPEPPPFAAAQAPSASPSARASVGAVRSSGPAAPAEPWLSEPGPSGSSGAANPAARLTNGEPPNAIASAEPTSAFAAPASAVDGPILRVVSGPNAGRVLALTKDEVLIGRVGTQVAAARRVGDAYRLFLAEGAVAPRVNGIPVPPEGVLLQARDSIDIAGAQLVLLGDPDVPSIA